jgi:putative ABC transport system substrate-binding protein
VRGSLRKIGRAVWLAGWFILVSIETSRAQTAQFRIGVLTPGGVLAPVFSGLRDGLEQLGYSQGGKVQFIVEDTHEGTANLVERARKLIETKPALLFTVTTAHALAAQEATSTVPIVFAWVGDPLQAGLIAGYASTKNNLTGVTSYAAALFGKRLELLKEIAPSVKRVLVLVSPTEVVAQLSWKMMEDAAKKLRIQLIRRDIMSQGDVARVLAATPKGAVDAIFPDVSQMVGSQREQFINKAKTDNIPLVGFGPAHVEKGALFYYGADYRLVGLQAARLVAKVLKGERPSDIPVEVPDKFLLTVNVTTAKAIGLKIPPKILSGVDRVVE